MCLFVDVVLTLRTWKPPWERGPAKIDTWLKSVAAQSVRHNELVVVPLHEDALFVDTEHNNQQRHINIDCARALLLQFGARSLSDLAKVEVVEEEISRDEMRLLYSISDVFVLPTRGEGWGLPAMEAMSMEVRNDFFCMPIFSSCCFVLTRSAKVNRHAFCFFP